MITLKVWIVRSAQSKVRSLLKLFLYYMICQIPQPQETFFIARKENVILRVIRISYDNKGFILALVLYVHTDKFQFPRTHLFFLIFSLSTENITLLLYKHFLNKIFTMKFRTALFHKRLFFPSNYLYVWLLIFSHVFSQHFRIIPAPHSIVN